MSSEGSTALTEREAYDRHKRWTSRLAVVTAALGTVCGFMAGHRTALVMTTIPYLGSALWVLAYWTVMRLYHERRLLERMLEAEEARSKLLSMGKDP